MRYFLSIVLLVLLTGFFSCDIKVENPIPDPKENPEFANWLIPKNQIINRGTPDDEIPAIDDPTLVQVSIADFMDPNDLILGLSVNSEFRAYPLSILNYHEVVNDIFRTHEIMISYSPLSGTSAAWDRDDLDGIASTFGVSEFIYNSCHILYDRETNSHWLPMFFECVNGQLEGLDPDQYPVIETSWSNWINMFPGTKVMTPVSNSGFNYNSDPFDQYKTDESIEFATQPIDERLFLKEKVHAIVVGERAKVYRYDSFEDDITIIKDNFQGLSVVIAGSKSKKFLTSFERRGPDGTELDFIPNNDAPNIVMEDNKGNKYDIFGLAVDGPNRGSSLTPTVSMTGYWFAIAAMYPDPLIFSF